MWQSGLLHAGALGEGLIYTAQFHELEAVVSGLSGTELVWFKDFLLRCTADTEPTDELEEVELYTLGNPPDWKMRDAFRLIDFLEKRDHEERADLRMNENN
ncbi:hypothetical protein [Verrucomicrobium sp. BvORR106]|uniref:hypothetical protein n=1 Tax=Verrucomicrobium sp. BvORR106 TaxID=1403819 RepID=UPI00056E6C05|nr:hypothetical protein [Verrucomicrobium sp. BvORR106]